MIDKGFFKLNEFLNAVFSLKKEGKAMIKLMKNKLGLVCKLSIIKSLLVGSLSYKINSYKVKNPLSKSGFLVENNKLAASYSHSKDFSGKKSLLTA